MVRRDKRKGFEKIIPIDKEQKSAKSLEPFSRAFLTAAWLRLFLGQFSSSFQNSLIGIALTTLYSSVGRQQTTWNYGCVQNSDKFIFAILPQFSSSHFMIFGAGKEGRRENGDFYSKHQQCVINVGILHCDRNANENTRVYYIV